MRKTYQVQCFNCSSIFARDTRNFKKNAKKTFCSQTCYQVWKTTLNEIECKSCRNIFYIEKSSRKIFCTQSCAATYNNKNKKTGYRRSKFEIWLESRLITDFPNENPIFNQVINGYELDVFFEKKKIAFEINGVVHYKPIYGLEKYEKIIFNDAQKQKMCNENNISLFQIDISNLKQFSPKEAAELYKEEIYDRLRNFDAKRT